MDQNFNKADSKALAEMYHDEAINHQVANEPVEGKVAIQKMFEEEFTAAEMVSLPENILKMASGPLWNGKIRKD